MKQFVPYQIVFGHLTRLRHFSVLESNPATVAPSHAGPLIAFIAERSGTTEPSGQKAWLRLHAPEVAEENLRLSLASEEQLASSIDLTASTTVYQSDREPEAWAAFLRTHSEFEEEPDDDCEDAMEALYGPVHYCFKWLRQAGASEAPRSTVVRVLVRGSGDQAQVLASIYVYQDHISLSGIDRDLMRWLMDRWSSAIAPGLVVESEGVRDLKASSSSMPNIQTPASSRGSQASLSVLDEPDDSEIKDQPRQPEAEIPQRIAMAIMKDHEEQHFRQLIDDSVPALQGKTPRQASKSDDPELLAILEQWAKYMIHSHANKAAQYGFVPNLFWFYQELNLEHLWPAGWPRSESR